MTTRQQHCQVRIIDDRHGDHQADDSNNGSYGILRYWRLGVLNELIVFIRAIRFQV